MVVISQVGCDEIAPIILEYGNGARFRTLRSTMIESSLALPQVQIGLFLCKTKPISKKLE